MPTVMLPRRALRSDEGGQRRPGATVSPLVRVLAGIGLGLVLVVGLVVLRWASGWGREGAPARPGIIDPRVVGTWTMTSVTAFGQTKTCPGSIVSGTMEFRCSSVPCIFRSDGTCNLPYGEWRLDGGVLRLWFVDVVPSVTELYVSFLDNNQTMKLKQLAGGFTLVKTGG